MNGIDILVPKTKKHNDIIVFKMMMFAMMLLMWGADLTDTVATTSLPWEMVTHELCAPPSPLHPLPPIRLFNWPFNLSAARCQLYGRKNLHEKKGRLIGVLPTQVGPEFGCSIFWIGNVCMFVSQNVCSKRLYERYSRPFDISGPLSHLTKTTHKFNAPNFNWFNFAGKVVIFSRRCHPRSRPVCALREPKIARSKSFHLLLLLPSWQLWSKSTKTGPLAVARARS